MLARLLGPLIKRGQLTVIHHDGEVEIFGTPDPDLPATRIRFTKRGVGRRIVMHPSLGTAEAYMDGALLIEQGDIWDLVNLYQANARWKPATEVTPVRATKSKLLRPARKLARRAVGRILQLNDQVSAKRNVSHHYDLGNAFYRLFLDEDMQYSCGYFPDPEISLEEAQRAKKAHIAAKLALSPGQRVLDIGCGWGGMALYLNRVADVDVLGITLSEEQHALACQRARDADVSDRVKFELIDYRDLTKRESAGFDRIVSVGMFEHVGQPQFETYFRCCAKLMKQDGVALIHTIGSFGPPKPTEAFTRKYIFPGGYIPALSETAAASEKAKLIAADVETLRLHYGWTIRHWYDRTVANRDRIVTMYDERFYRMWLMYLSGAAASFFWGRMGNFQIQFLKDRLALPVTREYMAAREAEYMAMG